MSSAKQLILLTPGFPENENDENCIPLLQVYVKALCKAKPDLSIKVIAFHYPFTSKSYRWYGIPVYPMNGRNKKGFSKLITWIKVWRQLNTLKTSEQEILLHSFWLTECYWLGSFYSRCYGTKHLATVLGQDAKKENRYLRLLKDKSCTIVCCSSFAAEVLKKEQGMDCKAIVPLGVDAREFNNQEQTNRTIDIIGVGNLGPVKRYDVFVNIIAEIRKIKNDVSAEIIGDGEFRSALQRQIDRLGLSDHIRLAGTLPRKQVLQRLQKAKVLLHTSSYEGQGYVYLEALASGCGIAALNRGYLPDSGKVIAVEQDEDLATACLSLLNKSFDGRSFVPVPVEQTVKEYLQLYNF